MIKSRQKDIISPAVVEKKDIIEDEFLNLDNIVSVKKDAARRAAKEAGNEIELLINEKNGMIS